MHELRGFALCLPLILVSLNGVKTFDGACPFAGLRSSEGPAFYPKTAPTESYVAIGYANNGNGILKQNYNRPQSSGATFQSLIQDYSRRINLESMFKDSDAMYTENMILKDFQMPNQVKKPSCAIPPQTCANYSINTYYRSIDGSCNNLKNPGLGMARSRYGRLLPPDFNNNNQPTLSKTGRPLPGARIISLSLFGDDLLQDEYRTLASMQWGQIVAHDISRLSTEDAPENCCAGNRDERCLPIALLPEGPISMGSGKRCLEFTRAISDKDLKCQRNPYYAEKISIVTAFLDLSYIYGNSLEQNKKVRQFSGGLLKTSFINNRQWLPITTNVNGECGKDKFKCYNIPDVRNQFIPSIIVIQTILVREHNRIACILSQLNPQYTDEELYQEARKINIAQYQRIVYYEWLPVVLGSTFARAIGLIHNAQGGDFVNDYDDMRDPAPYIESAAAALRYSHTQVPGYFSMVSSSRYVNETKRLSDFFERPSNIDFIAYAENFDYLIRGMLEQPQKRSDSNIDKEIKHFFNRKPTEEFGGDLKSIDITRGRDFDLPSYNDLREYCGLPRAYDWDGFVGEISPEKISAMQKLYGSPHDVELNVGAALEKHEHGTIYGPTFRCILGKQFLTARISDRFFFESILSGFSSEQLVEIRKASLSALICNNADYIKFIQPNSFIVPNPNNLLRSCDSIPQLDLGKWKTRAVNFY